MPRKSPKRRRKSPKRRRKSPKRRRKSPKKNSKRRRKSPKKRSKRRRKSPKKRSKRRRKFNMQSQTYNRNDFKEGDKFEKITWHYLGARNDEKGAYVDRKNRLYPWYPRVISVHPSYISVFISVRPNRYARIYYNLIKDVVWEGGIIKSLPKRPKSAMKNVRKPRKKARSPRKKPPSPRKVKAAKRIQKYIRKRSGRRKSKFNMQRSESYKGFHVGDKVRLTAAGRDDLRNDLDLVSRLRGRRRAAYLSRYGNNYDTWEGTVKFVDDGESRRLWMPGNIRDPGVVHVHWDKPAKAASRLLFGNQYVVYDDVTPEQYDGAVTDTGGPVSFIQLKYKKRPKSAMKNVRKPRKKARSPRKKLPSPRKVKAAKRIQKYIRKRSGRRKSKFKMQGQNMIRVFRDDLGRDFNKTDFYKNQVLVVIDSVDSWPQWSVRVKSPEDNNLEIYTELGEVLLIPYASIREVIYKQSPKRPKSAMKKSRKYKMQDNIKYVIVTVNDLGRDFNKNDFKVGQKIDIRRKWDVAATPGKVDRVENSKLSWHTSNNLFGRSPTFETNYNSIHTVRYHEMPKRPKSAMKKSRKYKMQGVAGGVTVTVNELGRDFNKDDFKVGQKIDIRRKLGGVGGRSMGVGGLWTKNLTVLHIGNSTLAAPRYSPWFAYEIYYNSIYSVKYPKMPKRPKSAMKKGGGQVKRKSPSKKARSPRKKPLSPRKVKAAKKIQKYVRKRSGRRKNKFKMQNNANYVTVTVDELGRDFNKNDFKVGQKIDIIRKGHAERSRSWALAARRSPPPTFWDGPWIIGRVENSGLKWTKECGGFTTKFDSIHTVRYHEMPKRPKSAMKKSRKYKMQDNIEYVIVTVNELGRNFNKNDFKIGQKIEIRRKWGIGRGVRQSGYIQGVDWWLEHVTVMSIENSELSCTMGNRAFKIDYNSIHSVRYYKEKKRPKSAMKKGRKYKMQGAANGVIVTVNELGRNFNKDDFYVGQKIDISPKAPKTYVVRRFGWWENLAVVRVENSKLSWRAPNSSTFETNYNSIHSVRYHEMSKRPKSAMKKSRKYKMQDDAEYVTITVNDLGREFNKNDFYVGQIVDIRRDGRRWSGYKYKIKNIDNSGVDWSIMEANYIDYGTNYNSIHSVRYYKEKKRPKSAMKKGRKYKMNKKKSTAKKADRHPRSRKPSIEDFVEVGATDLSFPVADTFYLVSDDYYYNAGKRYTLPNGKFSSARYLAKLKGFGASEESKGYDVFEIELVNRDDHKNAGQGTHLVSKIWFQPGPGGRWWSSDDMGKNKFKMQDICKCKSGGKCCCGPKCKCKNCPCKN